MRLTLRLSPSLNITIGDQLELVLKGQTIGQCIETGRKNSTDLCNLLFKFDKLNPQILLFHNNSLIKENDFSNKVFENDVLDVIPAIEGG